LLYDLVWYWNEQKTDMTNDQWLLGHWLGIAHRIRSDLTYLDPDKGRMCDSTIYSATCDNNRIATNNDMRKGTDIWGFDKGTFIRGKLYSWRAWYLLSRRRRK
jgi:hypothetical protein